MLTLEELGIEIRTDYRSDHEGAIFADLIDLTTAAALKLKVDSINLIVALADGSTDAAIIDQEALFVRYLNTDQPGLKIEDVSADEQGVIDGIENAFIRFGIENFGKEINTYGADGASTSRGQLDGIIVSMSLLHMVLGSYKRAFPEKSFSRRIEYHHSNLS